MAPVLAREMLNARYLIRVDPLPFANEIAAAIRRGGA